MTGDLPTVPARSAVWSLGAFSLTLLAVLAAFYYPYLSGQRSYYLSDLTYYYEPLSRFIGEALAQNRLPLWNPYCYCGMSQIAISAPGIFYPPNWVFAAVPFNPGLALLMIFHQWLAGFGGYLLVRLWRLGTAAAWLCGLVLALSGYMFALQINHPLAATAAWVPICLWGVTKISADGTNKNLLLVSLTSLLVFSLVSSGRPEIFALGLLILGAYILLDLTLEARAGNKSAAICATLWRCLSLAVGTLIAMPALLPLAEWTALSPRASGMAAGEAFRWSANWYDLLCLFLAQPLGDFHIFGNNYLALVASRPGFIPYVGSTFVSPVVVTLAFLGATDRSWRWRWVLLVMLVAGVVASLGKNTAVFPLLVTVAPILTVFRYPVKMMVLPVWCLAILAARGMFLCMSASLSRTALVAAALIWTLLLTGSLVLLLSPELVLLLVQACASALPTLPGEVYVRAQALIGQAGVVACGSGLATCALVWAVSTPRLSRKVAAAALLLATGGALTVHAVLFARQGAHGKFFAQNSHVKKLLIKELPRDSGLFTGQTRVLPLYFDPLTRPPWYTGKGPESETAYFYQYARQLLLPNTHMDARLAETYGYEAAVTNDDRKIFHAVRNRSRPVALFGPKSASASSPPAASDVPLSSFCRMTSTEIVLTHCYRSGPSPQDVPLLTRELFEEILEDRAMNVRIYRVKDFLPRAYIAKSWTLVGTHGEAVEQVSKPDLSGFDPRERTVVEPNIVLGYKLNAGSISQDDLANSWVKFLQDRPEHVALSVKADADSLVVLADHYYPGWRARLDGVPVDLHRANALQRAVFMPAGSHLLEFDYEPESLATGFAWANFGLCLAAGLALFAAGRKFWVMAKRQSRGW